MNEAGVPVTEQVCHITVLENIPAGPIVTEVQDAVLVEADSVIEFNALRRACHGNERLRKTRNSRMRNRKPRRDHGREEFFARKDFFGCKIDIKIRKIFLQDVKQFDNDRTTVLLLYAAKNIAIIRPNTAALEAKIVG